MYCKDLINLHERCTFCLDLITASKIRLETAKHQLFVYDNAKNDFAPIRLFHTRNEFEKQIKRMEAIRDWLVRRYSNIMQMLSSEADHRLKIKKLEVFPDYSLF